MSLPHIWDDREYRRHLDAAMSAVGPCPDDLPPDSPVRFAAAQAIHEDFKRRLAKAGIQARET